MSKINSDIAVLRADIPAILHAQFKSKCALSGYTMNDVIEALVEDWTRTKTELNAHTSTMRIVKDWIARNR